MVLLKDPNDNSKLRNYCFVHFEERSSAIRAVEEATEGAKPEMDGKELLVSYSGRRELCRRSKCFCFAEVRP